MSENEGIPPGWSYNPASWGQRLPIVALAIIGFGIATYMALFQLKVFDTIWETVLRQRQSQDPHLQRFQNTSHSDAALGAIGYLADAVTGAVGGTRRWRTMPWIVIMFGLAVGPLGFISILLVILQPVMFDAWCTLCLCSAAISVIMIGPAMDEFLASMQYMKRAKDAKVSLWKVFWGYKEVQGKVI